MVGIVLDIVVVWWRPGSSHGFHGVRAAAVRSAAPTAIANFGPRSQTFSIKITAGRAAMTATFIVPTAIRTIINPQQHPTQ